MSRTHDGPLKLCVLSSIAVTRVFGSRGTHVLAVMFTMKLYVMFSITVLQMFSIVMLTSLTRGWSLLMGKNLRLKLSATRTACSSGCSSSSLSAFLGRLCFPALPAMFVSSVTETQYNSNERETGFGDPEVISN